MKRLHYLQMSGIAPREYWQGHYARHQVTATTAPDFKSWCFPSRIEERVRPFQHMIGDAASVVDGHTLYPLYRRMLPPKDAEKLRSHLLREPVHGLPAMVGAGGPHSGWATFQAAYCDECVQEDISPAGVPYWRTEHQVPGLLFCAQHAKPLLAPCRVCLPTSWAVLVPLPGRRCNCPPIPLVDESELTEGAVAIEMDLARAASKLLDAHYLPELDARAIGALVKQGAARIGIPRGGEPQHQAWAAFISQPALRKSFDRMTYRTIPSHRVWRVLNGHAVLRHPLRTLALLQGLWGSWDAVEQAATAYCSLADPVGQTPVEPQSVRRPRLSGPRKRVGSTRNEAEVAELLARYRSLRREHPGTHREGLLFQLPSRARRVLDREELDTVDLEVLGDIPALDASMADHIYVRTEELVALGYPGRLSSKQLLEGHPMGPAWFRIRTLLPRATRALRLCVESKTDFVTRMRLLPFLKGLGTTNNEPNRNENL
ncbi:TniQ family protein [Ralstonia pseudosolanacearum]|uniref:TniQ family protein n=1 Tax=Ralstonia pseudosolanacearum TaxID=1310165 RepID=UPI00339478E7